MVDKLIINCSTRETQKVELTPEEIAQREYEASIPPVSSPTTEDRISTIEGTLMSPPAMEDRISTMEDVTMAILSMMATIPE